MRFKRFKAEKISDYPLAERHSKVQVSDFASLPAGDKLADWYDSLPAMLAAADLRRLIQAIRQAREKKKALIWGFGGHVVKLGLAPVLIDLMRRGFVSALATNGSAIIHDFEIAFCGNTSEDVEKELGSGRFGMARETGQRLTAAIRRGASRDQGLGEAVGTLLSEQTAELKNPEMSLLLAAHTMGIPATVHLAIGTDIIHNHPDFSGEAAGKCAQIDFQIFTQQVSELHNGGVYLNWGSAVILPEVFLKAVSLVRNVGQPLEEFTTANFDFIQHYRPQENVVRRPVANSGRGCALTGHHEIMLPLVAALL